MFGQVVPGSLVVGFIPGLSFQELLIVGIIAIVLFGKRLPEVAKTLGQQYSKFRKSLQDIQSQVNLHEIYDTRPSGSSSGSKKKTYSDFDDYDEASAPRFEPPPAAPQLGGSTHDAA